MKNKIITIDGSYGEGGGQVLRSSLSLSMITGKAFKITNIRAGRKKPGILRQHLTAIQASEKISNADIIGMEIGSQELIFSPGEICPGEYSFNIGSAGSTTLLFQTIFPAVMKTKDQAWKLTFSGGTHNPYAPPYDFLNKAFFRVMKKMGLDISADISVFGFYPAGGGGFSFYSKPVKDALKKIDITEKGKLITRKAYAYSSLIPSKIGQKEIELVAKRLKIADDDLIAKDVLSPGPGNIVFLENKYENITEVFTSFGQKGVSYKEVVGKLVDSFIKYEASKAAVGTFLADQLLLPLVLAGGGKFITMKPSKHTITNIEIIKKFLNIEISLNEIDDDRSIIIIGDIKNEMG